MIKPEITSNRHSFRGVLIGTTLLAGGIASLAGYDLSSNKTNNNEITQVVKHTYPKVDRNPYITLDNTPFINSYPNPVGTNSTAISVAENNLSKEIGSNTPVDFENNIWVNVNGETIFDPVVYGPYIGAILDKGGPSGPDVVLYPISEAHLYSNSKTLSSNDNENLSQVVFAPGNGQPWNINDPFNPNTGSSIVDQYGRTPVIGSEVSKS